MRAKGTRKNIRGTLGAEINSTLDVRASHPVVVKKRYSAFFGTTLDDLLTAIQPDAMILAGSNTHACIRTTAIDTLPA